MFAKKPLNQTFKIPPSNRSFQLKNQFFEIIFSIIQRKAVPLDVPRSAGDFQKGGTLGRLGFYHYENRRAVCSVTLRVFDSCDPHGL